MISPHSGTSRRGWLPALLLSLLFHGGLVLPGLLLSSPGPWGTGTGSSLLDTRVRTQKMEVGILIYESELPPRTAAKPSSQAQPAVSPTRPSAPIPARETMSSPKFDSAVAILQPGENEEQEESARTSPEGGSQGSGTGPGGGTTSFFEIPTEAQAIVYVIDRSASMGPSGALAAAKRELLASLTRLPPTARFQVVAYSSRVEPIPLGAGDNLALASPENIQRAASCIDAFYAEGATTAHVPALRRALALHADVIYFLTDADDLTAQQVRAVTVLNRGRSIIHAIQLASLHRSPDQQALQLLARENHGVYRSVAGSP